MRTTAILNLKGGVGKTVTAINLSTILSSERNQRVLLADADSQCNTSAFFGVEDPVDSLADVLRGATAFTPYDTGFGDLDVLPASYDLMDLDLSKATSQMVQLDAIKALKDRLEYDYFIIDCPPAFSAASAAALLAADDVIIPIKLDAFSLSGMAILMQQVSNMRRLNPKLKVAGLLPTMYYKSEQMSEAFTVLSRSNLPVFSPIRRSPKVDDMTFAQQPICLYSPRSAAGLDYRRFATEYMGGVR